MPTETLQCYQRGQAVCQAAFPPGRPPPARSFDDCPDYCYVIPGKIAMFRQGDIMPAVRRSASPASLAPSGSKARGLRLKPGTLAAVAFLFVAALVLAYLGGIMAGRSHWHAPQVGDGNIPAPETGMEPPTDEHGPVLHPSDLRYATALRVAPGEKPLTPPPAPTDKGKEGTAPAMPPGMRPAVAPGQTPPPPAKPASPATVFDYVYQVAAFKDMESVDDIRQRLEGRGYRTRMERRGKLYVIFLLVRGDAARAAEVPAVLKSLRLGEPLLRSKKPVH